MGEKGGDMETGGEGEESYLRFPFWVASRRRFKADDPFFAPGNVERELLAKQVALDLSADERDQFQNILVADIRTVFCPIVGCGARLNCLEDFEDHYHARHTASCSMCFRVYPTSRLLSIHVSEAHDSFFQAKVARGFPMYECLVEGCGVKLKSYRRRQQHLVDKHRFPKSFEFFKKSRPSKRQRQRQKNQHKQASYGEGGAKDTDMDVDEKLTKQTNQSNQFKQAVHREMEETEMDVEEKMKDLTTAVSKLSTSDTTPSKISFGHRHARGFAFVPRSVRSAKPTAQPDAKG